jgi:hypothetical protein
MANTTKLALPIMEAAQSQKHVTHNDALLVLDQVVQISIKGLSINTPPGAPVDGDAYVTGGAPTGAWATQTGKLATWQDGVWKFYTPKVGWIAYNQVDSKIYVVNTSFVWVDMLAAIASLTLNDSGFILRDNLDNTKQAQFETSGITTGTTRTFTLPDVTGTFGLLEGTQTFSGTKTFSGTFTVSAATASFGTSTAASTVNVGSGATIAATSKTVNIGTSGVATSTTNINIGSAVAGALGALNINSPTVTFGSTSTVINATFANASFLYTGIGGATADATNRLSINTPAALFNNAGTSINLVLNKNAAANDASFQFQTGFSTRALFGLLADDNFTLKVSANGSTFRDALVANRTTGAVSLIEHPKFSAYLNFGQNYTAGAWQDMLCNIARHNDQGDLVITSNVPTFTAPHAGYYAFGVSGVYETTGGTAPDAFSIALSVNGTIFEDTICSRGDAAIVSGETSVQTTALLKLAAGDTVKPRVFFTTNNGRILANRNAFWGHQVP